MMRAHRLGDRALRLERPEGVRAATLLARARALPGVVDAIVTEQHVALAFDAPPRLADADARALGAPDVAGESVGREHRLGVVYDGEDLVEVATLAQMSVEAAIEAHTGATYEVSMMGFLPGFAYLVGLDARLKLPRRATPRDRVPAGSVAIGGPYAGVYPFASPGGWHLLGRLVGARMFDPDRGARLAPGDRVRFERVQP